MGAPTWAQTNAQLLRNLAARGWSEQDQLAVRHAHMLAAAFTTGRFRAAGRPTLCHVIGVADVLALLGHGLVLVESALLHTVIAGRNSDRRYGRIRRRYARGVLRRHARPQVLDLLQRFAELDNPDVPEVRDARWVDPDLALLQLANVVEELDTTAEFLGPRHRESLGEAAAKGARAAEVVGDDRLAALLDAAARRASEAVPRPEHRQWLATSPGPPITLQMGWDSTGYRSLTLLTPRWARAPRRVVHKHRT